MFDILLLSCAYAWTESKDFLLYMHGESALCAVQYTVPLCAVKYTVPLCAVQFTVPLCAVQYTVPLCAVRYTLPLCVAGFLWFYFS